MQLKSDKRHERFGWNEPVMRHKGFICSEREQHLENCTQHCSHRGLALSSWLGWIKPALWKGNPSTFWETQPQTHVQICSYIASCWKPGKKRETLIWRSNALLLMRSLYSAVRHAQAVCTLFRRQWKKTQCNRKGTNLICWRCHQTRHWWSAHC